MIGIIDVGGGLRDIYSAGIYDYLLDNRIYFKYCLGVSAGSANMMSYLAKQRGRNKKFYVDYTFRKEYMSMSNLLKKGSYIDLDYIYSTLSNSDGEYPIDYETFKNIDSKYLVAATEAVSGETHYFTNEDVVKDQYDILKASCAIPAVCKPITVKGKKYYDGGVACPIPYKKALKDGCDKIIVILTRPIDFVDTQQKHLRIFKAALKKYPETYKGLVDRYNKYNESIQELRQLEKEGQVLIIAPKDCFGVETLHKDVKSFEKLYEEGYKDGEKIKEFICLIKN